MPYKPARPCPGRGPRRGACPNLIRGNARCCLECEPWEKKATRQYDRQRGNSGDRGYSGNWRKIRERKLSHDPLCQMCEKEGLIKSAILAHHLDENPFNNEDENLFSCCQSCHELIHKKDRFGRNKP